VKDNPILEVKDLHVRYGAYEAVKGVSFALAKGGILGIVGESGSGKSTIAKVLMGLHKDYSGFVNFPISGAARSSRPTSVQTSKLPNVQTPSLQMIFQDAVGSLNPRMTVGQALREVMAHHARISKPPTLRTSRPPHLRTLLSMVGLSEAVLGQYPRELSGGQCQRVSIARALACEPDILVADEPVSALDVSVQARVLNLLRDLRRELGLSILLIAHDLAVVKNVCDEICVMEKGLFVDRGESAAVFADPQSAYTKRLLAAVPRITGFAIQSDFSSATGASTCRSACGRGA